MQVSTLRISLALQQVPPQRRPKTAQQLSREFFRIPLDNSRRKALDLRRKLTL